MKISKNAFTFCKITITVLAWTAYLLKSKELILTAFLLLLFSAILKIRKAPLIFLYSNTIDKIISSRKTDLDEKGMRFAHTLGSVFSGVCVLLVYLNLKFAWGIVFVFAVMKTISALGYCPGEKVYSCMKNGCCSITRK
jgi:hypothetical protein